MKGFKPTMLRLRDIEVIECLQANLDALKLMSDVLDNVIKNNEQIYNIVKKD